MRAADGVHTRTCSLCEAMCGLHVHVENGRVARIRANEDDVWSRGYICPKGTTLGHLHEDPDRLRRPLVRDGSSWREVTWPQAFAEIERRLRPVLARGDRTALSCYIGNPTAHNFSLSRYVPAFVAMSQLPRLYSAGTVDQWPKNVAVALMYGGMWTIPLPDLDRTDHLLVLGANPHASQGSLLAAPDILGRFDAIRRRGGKVVVVDPRRTGTVRHADAWIPIRPGTDAALLMAMVHVLFAEGRVKLGALEGRVRGVAEVERLSRPFTPEAVADTCQVPTATIRTLARELAASNAFVMLTWSLQRAQHGEQPYWMAIALAAMLGGIGLPGRGVGFGYGSMGGVGFAPPSVPWAALPQGQNRVTAMIPVARIADMLLNPGEPFDFDGEEYTYPAIDLVYWAGGNPFHHHQDTNRLLQAWRAPSTIVVHEAWWNAHARHADVVLPVTTFFERDDLCGASRAAQLIASRRVSEPPGECLDDFAIFSRLAARLGVEQAYTEGRDAAAWIRHLYERTAETAARKGQALPDFPTFWETGLAEVPAEPGYLEHMQAFRQDPLAHPLATPSGRIELASSTIDGFGYADCPGHPAWLEPSEWLGSPLAGTYPLHLLANQPADKLHSQWDHASLSRSNKIKERARLGMNPQDAASRGVANGDVVRVFNARGSILAGAAVDAGVRPGVLQMSTGAWFDPLVPGTIGSLDKHGNPNVLTPDIGTSSLAQGPSPNTCLVQVERFGGELPPITCFHPPELKQAS